MGFGYQVLGFGSGKAAVPFSGQIEYLVVAGGGSGGAWYSGAGGGAGGGDGGVTGNAGGGSGIIILRVATVDYSGGVTGSPTFSVIGADTVIAFNGTGSYTA